MRKSEMRGQRTEWQSTSAQGQKCTRAQEHKCTRHKSEVGGQRKTSHLSSLISHLYPLFTIRYLLFAILYPLFSILYPLPLRSATFPSRNITIDGVLSEWHEDELVYDDSQNDSPWGVQNEIHKLYMTWDASALYIGVSGVQKDGNNLLVYIDTSPLSGITDASLLREPGNAANLWWWRRGNKFPQNFRPDFQWHMYQMGLRLNEGHGLFKLNPDNTTQNLNDYVVQIATGGGTGILGSAEIKIPWGVLYGAAGFPVGQEIKIIAMVTGGMDTRGTADPSDDLFGSARDTIPDQHGKFPGVWYESFPVDNWLNIDLTTLADRSTIPRKLKAASLSESQVKLTWHHRGVVERNLAGFNIYHSTNNVNFVLYKSVMPSATSYIIPELSSNTTHYFHIRAIYGGLEAGKSETVKVFLTRPLMSHSPIEVFGFPSRNLEFKVDAQAGISSAKLYYRFGNESERIQNMTINGGTLSTSVLMPPSEVDLYYYFEIKNPVGAVHYLPYNAPTDVYSTKIRSVVSSYASRVDAPLKLDFSGDVKINSPAYSLLSPTTIYMGVLEIADVSIESSAAPPVIFYELYTLNKRGDKVGLIFAHPVSITLRYFDEDIVGYDESKLAIYRIDGKNLTRIGGTVNASENTITATVSHLSKFGIFHELTSPTAVSELRRVIRPVFNPGKNEVVEFDAPGIVSFKIFDLNGQEIFSSERNFWDGRNSAGVIVMPGIYVYRLEIGTRKIYGSCVVVR